MKPRKLRAALAASAGLLLSCTQYGVFEDVGSDPHAPEVQLLGVAYEPAAAAEGEAAPAPKFSSPEGFTVNPFDEDRDSIVLNVRYTDLGGDLESIVVRDLDGTGQSSLGPPAPAPVDLDGDGTADELPAPDFFPGLGGTAVIGAISFTAGQEGPHRLEVWAEDAHGSRSEKVGFTVTFVY